MILIFGCLSIAMHVFRVIEKPEVDKQVYWYKLVPYAILVALDIGLSNVAFVYLEATFVEMCKSSMPAVVMLLSVLSGLEPFSYFQMGLVLLICIGLAISSVGEANFSVVGFITVMVAVFMGSTKLVISQYLIQGAQSNEAADGSVPVPNDGNDTNEAYSIAATDDPDGPSLGIGEEEQAHKPQSAKEQVFKGLSSVQILYLQTPISGMLLLIPSAVSLYLRVGHIDQLSDPGYLAKTLFIILLGGCLAINLDIFNLLAVKYTSAISLTIAGVARTSFIILASWLFFRNEITKMNFLGFAICLVGVVLYNIVKYQKLRREIVQDAYKDSNPPAADQAKKAKKAERVMEFGQSHAMMSADSRIDTIIHWKRISGVFGLISSG
ncbi:hypothetical protein NDN08_002392 [Rhodosorus marinus]|uniref:Sugar phosphate transporter domain-containing protein n=1 Tax=Rhodosorus marinus TaxID=101924 RepID=A0AAV8UUZ9_9RHOD|nr:hypothetical protein NDN08_002392 [Rhodosorus marinus]